MPQLAIFVTLKSKPGKRGALLELWRERVQKRAAENPLETSYVYSFDMRDDTVVTITEVFESMEAFHLTSHSEWFKAYMKEVAQLLDGEPKYHMATPQWTKSTSLGSQATLSQPSQSTMTKLVNRLPASGMFKKMQEYLATQLAISVSLKAKPGMRDAVKLLWDERVRQRALENPAETNYVYAFDVRDDTIIRIAQVFETMDAFHQIAHAKWFKNYMREVTLLLDGKPEYQMATPQWVK